MFDYALEPQPSVPFIDTMKARYDMWLLKRHGLPAMYWQGMLRGLVRPPGTALPNSPTPVVRGRHHLS